MQLLIGYYSAIQTVVEVGLGSFLHAFHIPFSGHVLSLNQALLLSLASRKTNSRYDSVSVVNGISVVSALLKSLSPIGKRLTPMLAITVQGFLFSMGIFLFGNNQIGILFGASLLSVWSFIQPLILAYLFFGEKLFLAIEKLWIEIADKLSVPVEIGPEILIGFIIFKVILSCVIASIGWRYHLFVTENYLKKIMQYKNKAPFKLKTPFKGSAVSGAVRDTLNPWMILSLLLTAGFMWLTEDSNYFSIFMYTIRVLAISWLAFLFIRAFPLSWVQKILIRFPKLKKSIDHALAVAEQKH